MTEIWLWAMKHPARIRPQRSILQFHRQLRHASCCRASQEDSQLGVELFPDVGASPLHNRSQSRGFQKILHAVTSVVADTLHNCSWKLSHCAPPSGTRNEGGKLVACDHFRDPCLICVARRPWTCRLLLDAVAPPRNAQPGTQRLRTDVVHQPSTRWTKSFGPQVLFQQGGRAPKFKHPTSKLTHLASSLHEGDVQILVALRSSCRQQDPQLQIEHCPGPGLSESRNGTKFIHARKRVKVSFQAGHAQALGHGAFAHVTRRRLRHPLQPLYNIVGSEDIHNPGVVRTREILHHAAFRSPTVQCASWEDCAEFSYGKDWL
mmetsp:Transcript_12636/g.34976  ORF Transcript_12636/g.34976 Transcript_12636/m.34976 type:complete len:319 (-) Transcript_12636:14-970(-)